MMKKNFVGHSPPRLEMLLLGFLLRLHFRPPCSLCSGDIPTRSSRHGVTLPATLTFGVQAPQGGERGVDLLHLPLCALTFLL